MTERPDRILAAIVAADVVGYSRLMGADEEGTLARLRAARRDVIDPLLAAHGGRVANTAGDSLLMAFPSAVEAARFARAMQGALAAGGRADVGSGEGPDEGPGDGPGDGQALAFRIGLTVGDVMRSGDDLLGESVNIAARLEALAEPGGIAASEDAWRQIGDRAGMRWRDAGLQRLKNIAEPVHVFRWQPADDGHDAVDGTGPGGPAEARLLAELPSLAVLPFTALGGEADDAAFCDGLTEDIITTLAKLSGLRVVARSTSFAERDRTGDAREAARALGVGHVLSGSVRRAGRRLRISAQLADAAGTQLWAERYDRTMEDVFAIQDEITMMVATEMQVRLTEGEQARMRYTTATNVEAWTLWAKGMAHWRQAVRREGMGQARRYWEEALTLDPEAAPLHAQLAFMHALDARFGWWETRATAMARASEHVARALEIDPENADAFNTRALICLMEGGFDEAVEAARRAVALAPGSADAAELASFVLTHCGHAAEALELSRRAIALAPSHPPVYLGQLANACRFAGRPEEAIAAFEDYNARSPGFGLVDLVLIHAEEGRDDAAREAAGRLLAARPGFTVADWRRTQFRRDGEGLARDEAALLAAGLPAGAVED